MYPVFSLKVRFYNYLVKNSQKSNVKLLLQIKILCETSKFKIYFPKYCRDIYPESRKNFYKEPSNLTWEEVLTTNVRLWVHTRTNKDNTPHGSGRTVEKMEFCLKLKRQQKAVMVILYAICPFLRM